jgi:hypothetical protein
MKATRCRFDSATRAQRRVTVGGARHGGTGWGGGGLGVF